MKKIEIVTALSLALAASSTLVHADDIPSSSVTGNVAITSDYVFRGLTQTWSQPAIQGGADLTLPSGFAAGLWGSNISEKSYPGASMELDLYASYGASISADWSWRAGLYGYVYPGGNLDEAGLSSRSFNTVEANAALTWKWLTLKYSHALTDYFAINTEQGYSDDSKGTGYLQLDASLPINDAWSVALHAAHTNITTELVTPLSNGATDPSYSDFGATLKYVFTPHWSASFSATYASNGDFYHHVVSFLDASDTHNCGGTRGLVMLQGTF